VDRVDTGRVTLSRASRQFSATQTPHRPGGHRRFDHRRRSARRLGLSDVHRLGALGCAARDTFRERSDLRRRGIGQCSIQTTTAVKVARSGRPQYPLGRAMVARERWCLAHSASARGLSSATVTSLAWMSTLRARAQCSRTVVACSRSGDVGYCNCRNTRSHWVVRRFGRRHVIASAHAICPSKPSVLAMSR